MQLPFHADISIQQHLLSTVEIRCGENGHGQCNVPDGISNVIAVTCPEYLTAALQFAVGTTTIMVKERADTIYAQCDEPQELSNAIPLLCGGEISTALYPAGVVIRCWGYNSFRQSNVPHGISTAVANISCGAYHSAVLLSKNEIRC